MNVNFCSISLYSLLELRQLNIIKGDEAAESAPAAAAYLESPATPAQDAATTAAATSTAD